MTPLAWYKSRIKLDTEHRVEQWTDSHFASPNHAAPDAAQGQCTHCGLTVSIITCLPSEPVALLDMGGRIKGVTLTVKEFTHDLA